MILVPQSLRHAKTRLSSIESQYKKVVFVVLFVVVFFLLFLGLEIDVVVIIVSHRNLALKFGPNLLVLVDP